MANRFHSLRLAATLAALLGAGCAHNDGSQGAEQPPRDALRSDLLGCYRLYTASGNPLSPDSFRNAAPFVRLDSVSLGVSGRDSVRGVFRLLVRLDRNGRPMDPDYPSRYHTPSWWADSLSDSIRLSFSDGFTGTTVILMAPSPALDTLSGRVEEWGDVGPTIIDRGGARSVRVPCGRAA